MMNKSIRYLLVASALLFSCQQTPERITGELEAIEHTHILDKRVEYCDLAYFPNRGAGVLSGMTVSVSVFSALEKLANRRQIAFEVELLPENAFSSNPWAVVALSVCNIRAQASHASELVTQALLGTPVKVFAEQDGWFLIQTPDRYFGWVDGAGIVKKTNTEMEEWKTYPKQIVAKVSGSAFSAPEAGAGIVSDLVLGNLLSIAGEVGDYYEIRFPDGRKAFVRQTECSSTDQWNSLEINIDEVLHTAGLFTGRPYLWGGTSPKMFDCSGFTKTVYYSQGLILQRDASQQTLYGKEVETSDGYKNLQPGDLLFFGRKASDDSPERVTHVGLYLGNLQFIHASGKVRVNSLDPKAADYAEHYEKAFIRARRIAGNAGGKGLEWITENEFYQQVMPK